MGETTSLHIGQETRKRLKVWKASRDMTYDEAINTLLDAQESMGELAERQTGGEANG